MKRYGAKWKTHEKVAVGILISAVVAMAGGMVYLALTNVTTGGPTTPTPTPISIPAIIPDPTATIPVATVEDTAIPLPTFVPLPTQDLRTTPHPGDAPTSVPLPTLVPFGEARG
jgi:hypothetical protein